MLSGFYFVFKAAPIITTIDFFILILAILGFFGFYWNKKIFTKVFWKIFFVLNLVWQIFSSFIPLPQELLELEANMPPQWLINIILLILFTPLLIALYLYAFKRKNIWNSNNKLVLKQPFSVNNVLTVIKRNTSKIWKFLFWLYVLFSIPGLLSFRNAGGWLVSYFIFFILIVLSFFAFCWQRKIFNQLFWKIFFVLSVVLASPPLHMIPDLASKNFWSELLAFVAVFIIVFLPRFFALYIYAFRSDKIWKDGKEKNNRKP